MSYGEQIDELGVSVRVLLPGATLPPKVHRCSPPLTLMTSPTTSLSSLEQPVEPSNRELRFPRLIVVPVYSQEVAGVRKEKERLTAALRRFAYKPVNVFPFLRH